MSLDGHDWELCGSSASPCATIENAVTKRSGNSDYIMIDGRKGRKRSSFEEFDLRLENGITVEGFNGTPVIKCRNSSAVFLPKNSKVTFRNLQFSLHVSEIAPGRSTLELESTIAILAENSSVDIINCHFQSVPIALQSFCIASCTNSIRDSLFESPFKAVVIEGNGENGFIENVFFNNKFFGKPQFSDRAIHVYSTSYVDHWNLTIRSCFFTYFGKAVHIYSNGNLLFLVKSSEFRHNHLTEIKQISSSAIDLLYSRTRDDTSRHIIINNCTFVNNTSYRGAAVNINSDSADAILDVSDSTFKGNTAMHGGGAICVRGDSEVNLHRSIFIDNKCGSSLFPDNIRRAHYYLSLGSGGALHFADRTKSTFAQRAVSSSALVKNCIFKNNTAEFAGGGIFANKRTILFNVYLESAKHTKDSSLWASMICSVYRMVLHKVAMRVLSAESNRDVAHFGIGIKSSRVDAHSKFACPIGSILHFKNAVTMPKIWAKWHPSFRRYGDGYNMLSLYCEQCPPGFYNLHESTLKNRTVTGTKCIRCTSGGHCLSGIIRAKDNFWGYKDDTDRITFIQLPTGYGCSGKECITYNVCAKNRKGILCGTCANGYSESTISSKCISNKECQRVKFWLIAAVSLCLFLIFILYKQEITQLIKSQFRMIRDKRQQQQLEAYDDRDDILLIEDVYVSSDEYLHNNHSAQFEDHNNMIVEREEDDSDSVTGFIKILSYFYQIEIILRAYSNAVGSHIFQGLRHSVSSFFNFEFSIGEDGSVTCALFDMTPIKKVALKISFVAMIFVALLVIFIFVKIYQGINYKFGKRSDLGFNVLVVNKGKRFSDRLWLAIFEIILLSYAVVTRSVFTLLTCVSIGSKQVLFMQGTVQCYKPWQYILMGAGLCWVIPFCFFVILLPGLLRGRRIGKRGVFAGILFPLPYLFHVAFQKCTMKEQEVRQNAIPLMDRMLKLISGPFKSKHKHQSRWEGVYLIRRLILVSVNSFVQDQIYKLYSLLLIQVLFLLHHVHMKPFKNKLLNMVETVSLTALIMLNCVKTFAVYDAKHGLQEEGADLLLLKIFAWTELVLVLFAPVVIGLLVIAVVIARIATAVFRLFKHLYYS